MMELNIQGKHYSPGAKTYRHFLEKNRKNGVNQENEQYFFDTSSQVNLE